MGVMTVFHGSSVEVREPRIIVGRYTKDFGPGFYCTVPREQAVRWAQRFSTPKVNAYEVRLDQRLDVLEFVGMDDSWLDFIASCRAGVPHTHDIVIGAMANDQIWNYIADFIDGAITREQFWALVRFKYPTHQICFCSKEALACLRFKKCEDAR